MQGADADRQPQGGPQAVQGQVGVGGHGGPEFRLVAAVGRELLGDRRAGGDFAGGLVAADEPANPLGGDGVLAARRGEGEAAQEVRQDALAEIDR